MENMHTDVRVERDKDLYVNWHFFFVPFQVKRCKYSFFHLKEKNVKLTAY